MAVPADVKAFVQSELDERFRKFWKRIAQATATIIILIGFVVAGKITGTFDAIGLIFHSAIVPVVSAELEKSLHSPTFDDLITHSFSNSVGESYEDHFMFYKGGPSTRHYILFYANPSSTVDALIEVAHTGIGPERKLSVAVDLEPVPPQDIDYFLHPQPPALGYLPWPLSPYSKKAGKIGLDPNIHVLTFDGSSPPDSNDIVSVNILINVVGRVLYHK
jgi:hypothetical protein